MPFKAQKVKKGFFEVHGLEAYVEKKFEQLRGELRKALGLAVPKKAAKKSKPAAKKPVSELDRVLGALEAHPRKADLLRVGKQKDQLLRALIPLYVGKSLNMEISSGVTSKFWAKLGVKFAAPNAAKALREHVGYARRTKNGPQITPNGIQYVEHAAAAKRAA